LEFDLKVTFDSFPRQEKRDARIVSTHERIQIDCSELYPSKANAPGIQIREPGSNVTSERMGHILEEEPESFSTHQRIQIDWSIMYRPNAYSFMNGVSGDSSPKAEKWTARPWTQTEFQEYSGAPLRL
jgi:hypothetical protein